MVIAELIILSDRSGRAQQVVGSLVVGIFGEGNIRRVDVAVEFALGRGEREVPDLRELCVGDLQGRMAAFGHDEGEGRLQQLGTAFPEDRVGVGRMQGLHLGAVNSHGFGMVGAEIDTHHGFALAGAYQRVADVLSLSKGEPEQEDDGEEFFHFSVFYYPRACCRSPWVDIFRAFSPFC